MKSIIFKRVGLASVALVFGLISIFPLISARNASAVGEEPSEISDESWIDYDPNGKVHAVANAKEDFDALHSSVEQPLLSTPENANGLVTINLHVKEGEGHFEGETDPQVHSKEFYFRDTFDDRTEPVSDRGNNYVFAGWSVSEEAISVDIPVGEIKAGNVASDLYAVWSDKAYVYYHIPSGVWENPVDGEAYQHVMMEYDAGMHFQNLNPEPHPFESNTYTIAGWYTELFGRGEEITEETIINHFITEVYLAWNYDADAINDPMELDVEYDLTAGMSTPVMTFTAPETALYEVYTDGITSPEGEANQGMVRIRDIFDRGLASEKQMEPGTGWADVHAYYKMQAGETYYIRFGEAGGNFISFKGAIRKAKMVDITFDADRTREYGGHFDGDPEKTTKVISYPVGYEIRFENVESLKCDDENYAFGSWHSENDEEHSYLLVTEDTDYLYATYIEMTTVHLDFNGGYHPFDANIHELDAKFQPGSTFESPIDPDIDDPAIDFVGWAHDPHATEPDVFDDVTGVESIKNDTLYAIYDEKVPVTFVVNGGGYMIDDPSITVFETAYGKGHVFYGMSAMHFNPNVKHSGWIDQNGVRTYVTDGIDGRYKIMGETTFTAVLDYEIIADANGGLFPNGGFGETPVLRVELSYEDDESTFSADAVLNRTGYPHIPDDDTKEFAGFATSEDATEPDIDDSTPLVDLYYVYVVWKDKEEPEPEPTPEEPEEEPEAPEVPDTGANAAESNYAGAATFSGLGAVIALVLLGIIRLFRKHNAQ